MYGQKLSAKCWTDIIKIRSQKSEMERKVTFMKAGFARLDITPPFGTCISGYFNERRADGILDPLQAHAIAITDGERTAAVVSLDVIGINQQNMDIRRS